MTKRSRRLFFGLFCFVILAGLAGGSCYLYRVTPRVIGARPIPAFTAAPRSPGVDYLTFLAVGDVGREDGGQVRVARAMSARAQLEKASMVLLLGDNFYFNGVSSVDDPRFKTTFEDIYNLPGLNVPFYIVLGNHDYYGNAAAQVEYSRRSSKWRLPDYYYSFNERLADGTDVLFVALDTNLFVYGGEKSAKECAWLDATLRASSARWKIVFGHHPTCTSNPDSIPNEFGPLLEPLLAKNGVDVYLSGHDHYQALIRSPMGVLQVTIGSGANTKNAIWDDLTLFASVRLGFACLRLSREEILIEFVEANGKVPFAYTIKKPVQ